MASVAPWLERFDYFRPYAEAFEKAIGGNLRVAFAAPPQHGKTLFTLLGLLYLARYFPGYRHAYVTFNETRAEEVAKEFRRLAERVGFAVSGTLRKVDLGDGTSVKFTSVKGDLTGSPIDGVCVIDDPIKNAIEARSATVRRDAIEWWKSVARTRRHEGTSYFSMATRWHVEDPTGYLIKHEGFRYLNFKAIAEPANDNDVDAEGRVKSDPLQRFPGEALCPSRKPPEFFDEERRDAYWWAAMYQGEPRPMGGAVFGEPTHYEHEPEEYRVGYGVDLAFTAKTSADFSVSIEGHLVVETGPDGKKFPKLYIVDIQRKQVVATSFALTLHAQQTTRGGPMRWYCYGPEKGSAAFIQKKLGPKFQAADHSGDKFVRATPVAAAWNNGQVLVPLLDDNAPDWLPAFIDEVTSFTGVKDGKDDQVDALAALWDVLVSTLGTSTKRHRGAGGSSWT